MLEDMAADSLDAGCSGDAAAAAHTDASDLPAEQRTRRRAPGKVGAGRNAHSSDWCCAMGRGGWKLPPWLLVAIFIYCNLLNYVDRGIVNAMLPQYCVDCRAQLDAESCNADALCEWQTSAAACGFNSSVVPRRGIGGSLQVNKTDQGVIAGSFMGGYCVFSPIFAYLSTVHKPFTLMGLGLLAWCAACGLASAAPTFGAFILARVVSGIGEASFQCIAPCFIDDSAPAAIKGKVLAAFFMAVPIGQALGYAYGGCMCSELDPSVLGFDGWRLAFALEGVAMMPVALLCFCVTNRLKAQDTHDGRDAAAGEAGSVTGRGNEGVGIFAHAWELVLDVVSNGTWLCTTLGYAGYTFSVGAIAVWVPSFLQQPPFGIALERADLLFGSIAVVTGWFCFGRVCWPSSLCPCALCITAVYRRIPQLYASWPYTAHGQLYASWPYTSTLCITAVYRCLSATPRFSNPRPYL